MKSRFLIATGLVAVLSTACTSASRTTASHEIARQPQRYEPGRHRQHVEPIIRPDNSRRLTGRRTPRPGETRSWRPNGKRINPRWTRIVLHHSATRSGSAKAFDNYHRNVNGWDELGYHFVIGNGKGTADGLVEVGSRWHKQKHGAHCKTPDNYYNNHGIGICLVGDFTKSRPTGAQIASLERLVRFLSAECNIPASRITTHGAVTGKTACPGTHFPVNQLKRSLRGPLTASSMP